MYETAPEDHPLSRVYRMSAVILHFPKKETSTEQVGATAQPRWPLLRAYVTRRPLEALNRGEHVPDELAVEVIDFWESLEEHFPRSAYVFLTDVLAGSVLRGFMGDCVEQGCFAYSRNANDLIHDLTTRRKGRLRITRVQWVINWLCQTTGFLEVDMQEKEQGGNYFFTVNLQHLVAFYDEQVRVREPLLYGDLGDNDNVDE